MAKYVVRGTVKGKSVTITKPSTKKETSKRATNLRKQMKDAIPKYRWVKNIKVVSKK